MLCFSVAINLILLLVLSHFAQQATCTDIWQISIYRDPAPPPGKGPPLQRTALRDLSYLPIQISSIVAAYLLCVLVIGTALLLVGRRLRRAAQSSPTSLAIEMIKPVGRKDSLGISPISQEKGSPSVKTMKLNWPGHLDRVKQGQSPTVSASRRPSFMGSLRRGSHSRRMSESQMSLATMTTITVDESVLEDDRARNDLEMERLFSAALDEDQRRAQAEPGIQERSRSISYSQPQYVPELQQLRGPGPSPLTSSFPIVAGEPVERRTLTKSPKSTHKPAPISIVGSRPTSRSSRKASIRDLPISPPLSPPLMSPAWSASVQDQTDMYGTLEASSPRLYPDPGPPPLPPHAPTQGEIQITVHQQSPANEHPRSRGRPEVTHKRTPSSMTDRSASSISSRKTPPPLILRTSSSHSNNAATTDMDIPPVPPISPLYRPNHQPLPQPQSTGQSRSGANVTPSTLPFRALHPQYSSTTSPRVPYNKTAISIGMTASATLPPPSPVIRQTILERKPMSLHTHANRNLRSPGTAGLGSAIPATPYSPYMPRTPLTPMTPSRLVTREERRRREREEGRHVLTEADRVEEEGEMWGDGW